MESSVGFGGGSSSARYLHHLLRPPQQPTSDSPPKMSPERNTNPELDLKTPSSSNTPIRRPRGRPSGSKNKPKPPIIITRDSPNSLKTHVLEVITGSEVLECVSDYARRRGRGVCILSGTGVVSNVSLRQPGTGSTIATLRGNFEILSMTGTVLPPPAPPGAGGLTVFLSGGPGQVVGGSLVPPLIATGPVVLMAATFANAVYERLPIEGDEEAVSASVEASGAQVGGAGQQLLPQHQQRGSQSSGVTGGGEAVGGVSFYNLGVNMGNYPSSFPGDNFGWGGGAGSSSGTTRPPF